MVRPVIVSLKCLHCYSSVPTNTSKEVDFTITILDRCTNDQHKRIHCNSCDLSFFACFWCCRIDTSRFYSRLYGKCKCKEQETDGKAAENYNNAGGKGNKDTCELLLQSPDPSVTTHGLLLPPMAPEESGCEEFDECAFHSGVGGAFDEEHKVFYNLKSSAEDEILRDLELHHNSHVKFDHDQVRAEVIPTKTKLQKVFHVLSNRQEYPKNSARYFLS